MVLLYRLRNSVSWPRIGERGDSKSKPSSQSIVDTEVGIDLSRGFTSASWLDRGSPPL